MFMNDLNISIIDGYWTLNEKPLNSSSYAKNWFFSQYVRMSSLKQPLSNSISVSFKNRPSEIKQRYNHKFTFKKEDVFIDFPNLEKVIFEVKKN